MIGGCLFSDPVLGAHPNGNYTLMSDFIDSDAISRLRLRQDHSTSDAASLHRMFEDLKHVSLSNFLPGRW